MSGASIDSVNALLPQTQCEECGYKGCRPYAEAIIKGENIDLCAPGGEYVYSRLASHVGTEGDIQKVQSRFKPPSIARIDQTECIGCMKCTRVCPTDAIVGSKKQNHFILEVDCTGCGLCLPVCPVDCIDLLEESLSFERCMEQSAAYKDLYDSRLSRLESQEPRLQKIEAPDLLSEILNVRKSRHE